MRLPVVGRAKSLQVNRQANGICLATGKGARSGVEPRSEAQEADMSLEEVKRSLGILAVVGGIATAVACGGSSGYSSSPTAPNPTPSPGGASADVTITINGMQGAQSYSPNPATVKAGQTVAWKNADAISHTATGAGFDTGAIGSGQTSTPIKFSTAGSIDYHCSFHPSMVGTLTVQ
jgi:plastocyanin